MVNHTTAIRKMDTVDSTKTEAETTSMGTAKVVITITTRIIMTTVTQTRGSDIRQKIKMTTVTSFRPYPASGQSTTPTTTTSESNTDHSQHLIFYARTIEMNLSYTKTQQLSLIGKTTQTSCSKKTSIYHSLFNSLS